MQFIQVQKGNPEHFDTFKSMMVSYIKELDAHKPGKEPISDEFIFKITKSCMDVQGPHDRHLELVYVDEESIGFLYGKVDHEDHKGHKKPGYGYIMEFYVRPEYRRKGYGEDMFRRLERLFFDHDVKRMYLTTGTSGEAFWKTMGFTPTDEVQPDNDMLIFEKPCGPIYGSAKGKMQIADDFDASLDELSGYTE